MHIHWLNKSNNKNLIVFFAGWSFDYYPFVALDCGEYDVLMVYDYNVLDVPDELRNFGNYDSKILIAWSMGVYCAYLLKDLFNDFDYKLAINGTVYPVNNEFGIPIRSFELTLKFARKSLEEKFYQNIFLTDEEYNIYLSYPVRRTIDNQVSELENLYSLVQNYDKSNYEEFYNLAMVSEFDKIIPPKNQIAGHNICNIPIITIPYGHYPFYYFSSWDEIVKCRQTIN